MKQLSHLALFVLLLLALKLPAQMPYFKNLKSDFFSEEVTINRLYQTRDGFIWLGTSDGLYRFNGIDFERIARTQNKAFKNITALFETANAVLWMGMETGKLAVFHHEEFNSIKTDTFNIEVPVTDILQDTRGRIWIATYGQGILLKEGNSFLLLNDQNGLKDNFVYDLELGPEGDVWAGTDAGIAICSLEEQTPETLIIDTRSGLPDIIITCLKKDQYNNMLIGMQDAGICYYDFEKDHIAMIDMMKKWRFGTVTSLIPAGENIWIGTSGEGIISYHPEKERFNQYINIIQNKSFFQVNDMMACMEGNYWIASGNELIISPGEKFEFFHTYRGIDFSNPLALHADKENNLWFSTERGLYRYRGTGQKGEEIQQYRFLSKFRDLNIMSIYRDRHGFVWLGTFGRGLFRLDPGSGKIMHFTENDGLINNNVLSIDGRDDEIWLATLGGVSRLEIPPEYDHEKRDFIFQSFREESGLGNNFIYEVFADSKNRIWFGTDGNGITVYDKGSFTNYNEKNGLADKIVYSVTEDRTGLIWFSTSESGIYSFNGEAFKNYGMKEGLRDLNISGIEADEDNDIIILHDAGIDILDRASDAFRYYAKEVGLFDIDPNLNAISRDQNGNVWFGTQKGIVQYRANEYKYRDRPITQITGVSVYLQPRKFSFDNKFAWDQNHFSFSYIGLWYIDPQAVTYEVMLEGHDLDWNRTRNRFITYSQLSPGEYTFKVRSGLRDDFQNAEVREYAFEIRSAFWNTFWFYSILAVALLLIIFAYIKYRENRLRLKENLKKEKLEFEFQTLKNQVNPHFLFNSFSTLISLIENDDQLAVEYVEKLSAFFRNILQYRDLELISLEEEIGIIETYFFIQQKRYGRNLQYEIDIPEKYLDSFIPPLTLQMLVENAVKHNIISRTRPLRIKLFIRDDAIVVSNPLQPKMEKEKSTGVGLKNIMERYKIIAGQQVKIQKDKDQFSVLLPLIKKYKK